jgi:hypothetical protein
MCDCIQLVNVTLKTKGLQLVVDQVVFQKPAMTVHVERVNGPVKIASSRLTAMFCPICGERYK